jgi:catechol 2,3-dioxygenase-like lactoylglutathione lyase family enzyme
MKKLPLLRIAEVAFLSSNIEECVSFYRKLGLEYSPNFDRSKIQFTNIGEQLFGFSSTDRGFFSGYDERMVMSRLHIAFEVPSEKLDECISFLHSHHIECSPKNENSKGWHGAERSQSVYFTDPEGNILELWAPLR